MTRRPLCALLGALLLVWTASPSPHVRADEPVKDETKAEQARKALDQVLDLDLAAESFDDVAEHFHNRTKVAFALDRAFLIQFGIDPAAKLPAPVQATLKGVKVRDAVRHVFAGQRLTPVVVDGAVLVTGEDVAAQRQAAQRVRVDVDEVPLEAALKRLARQTAANVVLDRRAAKEAATAKVSLQVEDVTLETAATLLAELAGMKAVRIDNVLFVTSRAQAKEIVAEQRAAASPTPSPNLMPGGGPNLGRGGGNLGFGGGMLGALGIGGGGMYGALGGGGGLGVPPPAPPPPPRKPGAGQSRRKTSRTEDGVAARSEVTPAPAAVPPAARPGDVLVARREEPRRAGRRPRRARPAF